MIDPLVEAREVSRRIKERISSCSEEEQVARECAQLGLDWEEAQTQRAREEARMRELPARYQAIIARDACEGKRLVYPEYRDERLRELGIADLTEENALTTER